MLVTVEPLRYQAKQMRTMEICYLTVTDLVAVLRKGNDEPLRFDAGGFR